MLKHFSLQGVKLLCNRQKSGETECHQYQGFCDDRELLNGTFPDYSNWQSMPYIMEEGEILPRSLAILEDKLNLAI